MSEEFQEALRAKYADKVNPEHKMAMEAISLFYVMLGQCRPLFDELIRAEERMHPVGMIVDPTLYRDALHSDGLKYQLRLVRAATKFLDEIAAVEKEIVDAGIGAQGL